MGFEASIALSPQSKAVLEKLFVLQLATKNLPSKDEDDDYAIYTISHNRTLDGAILSPFKSLFPYIICLHLPRCLLDSGLQKKPPRNSRLHNACRMELLTHNPVFGRSMFAQPLRMVRFAYKNVQSFRFKLLNHTD